MPNTLTSIFVSNPATEPVEAPHPNTGVYVTGTQAVAGGPWTVVHTLITRTTTPLTMVGRLKNFPTVAVSVAATGGPNGDGNIFNNILATPTGASATGTSSTTINVAVSSISNQTAYRLLASDTLAGTYTQIYQGTTASFPHTGLAASQTKFYKWQYVGGGYYDDSPLTAAFSGSATAAADNVVMWGNSIFAGVGGASITTTLPSYLTGKTVDNRGVGGTNITQVRAKFDAEGVGAKVAGARNVFVGFEGINTFAGAYLDARGFADAVKSLCTAALAAGYVKVMWFSTTPRTIVVGTSNDSNPNAVLSNSYLAAELPPLGVTFATLSATLIGKFGTAAGGQDAGYSSYGTTTAPSTINASNYFQDGTHPNAKGMDIFARVIADYTLNVLAGTALPDRSAYNQVITFTGITGPATVIATDPAWAYTGIVHPIGGGPPLYLSAGSKANINIMGSKFTLSHADYGYGCDYDIYIDGALAGGVHVGNPSTPAPISLRFTSAVLAAGVAHAIELRATGPKELYIDQLVVSA